MIFCNFQTVTHGKWILAGEHAVLRGHPALVFPVKNRFLSLEFETCNESDVLDGRFREHSCQESSNIYITASGSQGSNLLPLFWQVLAHGLNLLGYSLDDIRGHFTLHNTIPIGMGMGASAALCVAVSRWLSAQMILLESNILPFAQTLEHLFHGQSSGVDIAGASALSGLYFQQGQTNTLIQTWMPHWYLSSCHGTGFTSPCIQTVQQLWNEDADTACHIDKQMQESVEQAKIALAASDSDALETLAQAINTAASCFQQWGLMSHSLKQHMQALRELGALAVKPTGSGGGGYVLSLWKHDVPQHTEIDWIAV